ncbi:Vacuolar protein sorting-associated protein 26 [Mucor velutinosus]|uniref:Vacuolar protein sorting-associated protein 26 n=1 Tax=Mucor velutinosus TaxID=708070 RepID=A0AAN7I031_9FUNG|nr:Vacuolar protein sorting-associated protein 26 [Mucor velutinosus]
MSRTMKYITGLVLATAFTALVSAAGEEDVFELQPEIHHVFRAAEKMPPASFSKLFTLITLSPWLVLLGGWLQLGITPAKVISELVSGPTVRAVSIAAFVTSLLAVEYLFYLYWTQLNLFQTLTYLSGLTVITFFAGQRALSSIQSRRISNELKK